MISSDLGRSRAISGASRTYLGVYHGRYLGDISAHRHPVPEVDVVADEVGERDDPAEWRERGLDVRQRRVAPAI